MARRNIDDLINDLHLGVSKKKKEKINENTEKKEHDQSFSHNINEEKTQQQNHQEKELYELRDELLDTPHQINFDFIPIKKHPTVIEATFEAPENFNKDESQKDLGTKEQEQHLSNQEIEPEDLVEKSEPEPKLEAHEDSEKKIHEDAQKTITNFVKLEDKHEEHKLLQDKHEEIKLLAYDDPEKKKQEISEKKVDSEEDKETKEKTEKNEKSFKSEIKKILMIMPQDEMHSVLATPTLKILRKQFPESEIHALINEQSQVLENNPHLNKIITCNEEQAKQGMMNPLGLYTDKEFVNSLKSENYDAAISLEKDRKNIVLTNSIRARNRFAPSVFGLNFFVNNNVEINDDSHKIEQYLSLVSPLIVKDSKNKENKVSNANSNETNATNSRSNSSILTQFSTEERKVDFFLTDKEISQAKKLLENYDRPIVCVSCSASTINRQWSQEKWAELLSNMVRFHGAKIIFVGHDIDKEFVKHVIEKMKYKKDVRNLVDKNLRISAALIAESDLFVGTNSEYLHIARALKTPLIGLFGPDNNKLYGYHEQTYRTIRKHTVCEYCDNPKALKDLNQSCLKEIDPSEILPIANELLRK